MRRRPWALPIFFALFAPLPGAVPVRASCECDIWAEGKGFTFWYHDACPYFPKENPERVRALYAGFARWLAFVAACRRRIEADPALERMLSSSPIHLQVPWRGKPLEQARGHPFGRQGAAAVLHPDSVFRIFRRLSHDSVATMYSVKLGTFRDGLAAVGRMNRLEGLRHEVGGALVPDSTLAVRWSHPSCGGGKIVDLFATPPGMAGGRGYQLFYGLFFEREDAIEAAKRIRGVVGATGRVAPVLASGALLEVALAH